MIRDDDAAVELSFRSGYVDGYRAALADVKAALSDEQQQTLQGWTRDVLVPWSRADDAHSPPHAHAVISAREIQTADMAASRH